MLLTVAATVVCAGFCYAGIIWMAVRGRLTLTAVAIVIQAVGGVMTMGVAAQFQWRLRVGATALDHLLGLEGAVRSAARLPGTRSDVDGRPTRDLRFERVSFSYPDSDEKVLDSLNLTIPAGVSTAIVGANGAGKTTLVKLLCRLHDPTSGRVLVDGEDLSYFDPAAWRMRLGVVFQDFVQYALPLRDNVAFGAIELAGDQHALEKALQSAGAQDLLALEHGWDTVLSRQYTGGTDLSGGQWQRVALARALFAAQRGGILVLDEPTANLDVRAEAELFDRFLELTRGVTTVLISHRFSSVRRAQHICVLEGGRLVEEGTHDALLAAGGSYAYMFRLQADRFDGTRA